MTRLFKDTIIPWVFKWEGTVYENDPNDAGGATKYGIDQRSHPNVNIKNLTAEEATDIYWSEYWIKFACDHMDWPMNFIFFNCCVNCGFSRAHKILKLSGDNGSKFLKEQEAFYKRLVDQKPSTKIYLKGWLNRTKDLRKVCVLS